MKKWEGKVRTLRLMEPHLTCRKTWASMGEFYLVWTKEIFWREQICSSLFFFYGVASLFHFSFMASQTAFIDKLHTPHGS